MCRGPRCPPGAGPSRVAREAQDPEAGQLPGAVPRRCPPHLPPPSTAPDHCRQQRAVWGGCAPSPFLEGMGEPGGPATSLRGNTGPLVMCLKDTQDGAEGRPCRDSAWPVAPPTGRPAHAPPTLLWPRLHQWIRPPCCGSAHLAVALPTPTPRPPHCGSTCTRGSAHLAVALPTPTPRPSRCGSAHTHAPPTLLWQSWKTRLLMMLHCFSDQERRCRFTAQGSGVVVTSGQVEASFQLFPKSSSLSTTMLSRVVKSLLDRWSKFPHRPHTAPCRDKPDRGLCRAGGLAGGRGLAPGLPGWPRWAHRHRPPGRQGGCSPCRRGSA